MDNIKEDGTLNSEVNEDETKEIPQDSSDGSSTDESALEKKNVDLYARARKAEAELKEIKSKEAPKEEVKPDTGYMTKEEYQEMKRQEDLDRVEASEEVKNTIKTIAQNTGKSISEVANDPYIISLKEQEAQKVKEDAASAGGRTAPSYDNIQDITDPSTQLGDLSTEEGQKNFDKYEAEFKEKHKDEFEDNSVDQKSTKKIR